jgi:hypothetical protein
MEMMEINEALTEQDAGQLSSLTERLQHLQEQIYAPVRATIENFRDDTTSPTDLLKVKEYYFQNKYLERIKESLNAL